MSARFNSVFPTLYRQGMLLQGSWQMVVAMYNKGRCSILATHNKVVDSKVVVAGNSMVVVGRVVLAANVGNLNTTNLLFVILRFP